MKLIRFITILFFILFFQNIYAVVKNKIVIKVDDKIITNYEIKNKINTELLLRDLEINQVNINKMKNLAVQELINLRIKQKEINKYNNSIEFENIDISNQLKRISNGNIEELKNKFSQYNLNYEAFINELKVQVAWQKIIFRLFNNKVSINEDEILKEIQNIKDERKEIKEYDLSEIEISFSTKDEKDKKIILIQDKIKEIGFEKTVAIYSESSSAINKGRLGFLSEDSLSENIFNSLKNLNVGQISKPIINVNKILFLKINKIKKSKDGDLDITLLKNNLIDKKKIIYLIYIHKVTFQNSKIIHT